MFVGVSRPGPACEPSVSSRDLGDQRLRPGPEQMARRKRSTCAQDRLQFSEALGLATTVTGLGRSLSSDCRSKGVPSDHCWIVFTVTSNSEVTAGEVSLRYELEPTGGPDAGPGLPGWVTPRKPQSAHRAIARSTSRGPPSSNISSTAWTSATIPVTSADRARHVLEIMPPRTSARVARVAELTTTFAP